MRRYRYKWFLDFQVPQNTHVCTKQITSFHIRRIPFEACIIKYRITLNVLSKTRHNSKASSAIFNKIPTWHLNITEYLIKFQVSIDRNSRRLSQLNRIEKLKIWELRKLNQINAIFVYLFLQELNLLNKRSEKWTPSEPKCFLVWKIKFCSVLVFQHGMYV